MRIEKHVTRGAAITIMVDGMALPCFEGETIATAMLAHGQLVFRRDTDGHARGLYCNMGSCGECMVTIAEHDRRVRACVTDAHDGQDIRTDG